MIFNEFEGEEGTGNHVYLIWKIETFLSTLVSVARSMASADSMQDARGTAYSTLRFCLQLPQA